MKESNAFVVLAVLALGLVSGGGAHASSPVTVTFDDLSTTGSTFGIVPLPSSYDGLNWSCDVVSSCQVLDVQSYPYQPNGYQTAAVSGTNVLSTASDTANTLTIGVTAGSFSFDSVYLTSAWHDGLDVAVTGLNGTTVVDSANLVLNNAGVATLETFDWTNVTSVTIAPSGGTMHPGYDSNGVELALDNLTYSIAPVPEPAEWALILCGLGMAAFLRLKRRDGEMSMRRLGMLACVFSMSLGSAHSVEAQTLGQPTIDGEIDYSSTLSSGGATQGGPNGEVTISAYYGDGTGSVSAVQGSFVAGYNDINQASSQLFSTFEVVGPANSTVPLMFSVSGSTSAAGGQTDAQAYAYLGTSANSPDIFGISAQTCAGIGGPCSGPTSFAVSHSFTATTNTVYFISIEAGGSSNEGIFSAQVDPSVTFDSHFASSGYSLVFSADTSPSAPVPEPSSMAMLAIGLVAIGGWRYRPLRKVLGGTR